MSETWKNPLKGWHHKGDAKLVTKGSKLIIRAPRRTDCWRKTRQGLLQRTVDNAPFHWQKVSGDFQAIVKISGGFSTDYDKAGIMVRLDEEHWILTGMEFCNERVNHSTSVALDHSDWSMAPLPVGAERDGMWFCFKRVGNVYECFHSFDGRKWVQTRQGIFTEEPVLYVGVACACPSGDEFRVTFDNYQCTGQTI